MSRIHYKFKSSIEPSYITFDGIHISLRDLKKAIMLQKKMKIGEFDLEIQNAQSKQVYSNNDELIPKNTSVIVTRNPVGPASSASRSAASSAIVSQPPPQEQANTSLNIWDEVLMSSSTTSTAGPSSLHYEQLSQTANLANANATEDDKIKAMMHQSTKDFDPSQYKVRYPTGRPNPGYVCYKCGKPGHFINECQNPPSAGYRPRPHFQSDAEALKVNKRSTGIPMSFMEVTSNPNQPGAYMTHQGQYVVPTIDKEAYTKGKKELPPFLPQKEPEKVEQLHIPSELLCTLCKELLVDAVVIPCCGASFCDECIRNALLETEDHECPTCNEIDISPDRLITNKFLRMAVNNFKNDTGYTKVKRMEPAPVVAQPVQVPTQHIMQRPVVPASNPAILIPPPVDINTPQPGLIPGQPMNTQVGGAPPTLPTLAQSQKAANPAISIPLSAGFSIPLRQPGVSRQEERPRTPPQDGHRYSQHPRNAGRASNLTTLVQGGDHPETEVSNSTVPSVNVIPPPGALIPPRGSILGIPPMNGGHIPGFPPPALIRPPGMPIRPPQMPLTEEQFYMEKNRLTRKGQPHRQRDIYDSFANEIYKRENKNHLEPGPAVKNGSRSRSKSPKKSASRSRSKSRSTSRPRTRSRSRSLVRQNAKKFSRSRSRSFSASRFRTLSRSRSRSFERAPRRAYPRSFSRSRSRSLPRYRSFSRSPVRRYSPIRSPIRGAQWRRGGRYRSPPKRRFSPQRYRRGRYTPSPPRDDEFYRYRQSYLSLILLMIVLNKTYISVLDIYISIYNLVIAMNILKCLGLQRTRSSVSSVLRSIPNTD